MFQKSYRLLIAIVQLLAGISLVLFIVFLIGKVSANYEKQNLPNGWQLIRPPQDIMALTTIGDNVWAGGKEGLFCFDRKSAEQKQLPFQAASIRYVKALLYDKQGVLWIAYDGGISRFKNDIWDNISVRAGSFPAAPRALMEDQKGIIWIGTDKGLYLYQDTKITNVDVPKDLGMMELDVLYEDRNGIIWFGCSSPVRGGLFSFDGSSWKSYSQKDGLIHASVNAITEDSQGALWIGTGFANRGGACCLIKGVWKCWTKTDGLAGEKVRSVYQTHEGALLFGSEYDGLSLYSGGNWKVFNDREGLAGKEVKVIAQDKDGVLWLGTNNGLNRIEKNIFALSVKDKSPL